MPFSFQVADGLVTSGAAKHVLVIGAEAHAGFMPWRNWGALEGDAPRDEADYAFATEHRGTTVLFGDGAGAAILRHREGSRGVMATRMGSNGALADILYILVNPRLRHG